MNAGCFSNIKLLFLNWKRLEEKCLIINNLLPEKVSLTYDVYLSFPVILSVSLQNT